MSHDSNQHNKHNQSNQNGRVYRSEHVASEGRQEDEASAAKRKLEAMFSGITSAPAADVPASVPDSLKIPVTPHKMSGAGGRSSHGGNVVRFASPRKSSGRAPSDYRMRLEQLRISRGDEMVEAAINTFLKHHQLPDEADVLLKVLNHSSEKVVREALGQISSLLMQGRMMATVVLYDHLERLEKCAQEDATHSYIQGLRMQTESA